MGDDPGGNGQGTQERNGVARTLAVSFLICLVCSLVLSVSTVVLRPIREANERAAQSALVASVLGDRSQGAKLDEQVEVWVVELATGERSPIDPASFDAARAAGDPIAGRSVPPDRDVARIQRQARHGTVQIVRRGDKIHALVLPVYGRGYASVIHASVVLAADANTVLGLAIHEHAETPGIGSEIEQADWRDSWVGKRVRDPAGALTIRVSMGEHGTASGDSSSVVDGISGATRSSLGVGSMVRFWLSDDGFEPFLERVRKGEIR